MIHIFQSVANFFKFKRLTVDNNVFRLHYRVTVGALILFSIVVSAYQFFGEPVKCMKDASVPQNVLETFCWAQGTYSIPESFDLEYGEDIPYPGVDNSKGGKKSKVYHKYYQWVCFVLLLQAIMFTVPHYLWKTWEGGKIKDVILNLHLPVLDYDELEDNKKRLVHYLVENMKSHNFYTVSYFLCEVLNFANVVGQMFMIDKFLGYTFSTYGTKVLEYTQKDLWDRPDVMTRVFPKMAKCTFHLYGSGGSVETIDVLCVIPLNTMNEKIFVFMWFWFILLAVLTAILLVYRLLILAFPSARYFIIIFKCMRVDKDKLHKVLSHSNIGDWFVFNLIAKNVDPTHFKEVISDLSKEVDRAANNKLLYINNGDKLKGHEL